MHYKHVLMHSWVEFEFGSICGPIARLGSALSTLNDLNSRMTRETSNSFEDRQVEKNLGNKLSG